MTPKEKAKELVNKYINLYPSYIVMFPGDIDKAQSDIKQCALIAIDELIEVACDYSDYDEKVTKEYWQQVKQEIENL